MFRNERQAIIDGGIMCVCCVLWLLIYAGLTSCAKPGTTASTPPSLPRTVPVAIAPAVTSPAAVMSPWLCVMQPQQLYCQAATDIVLRRGQKETRVARGSMIGWTGPTGSGQYQVWFGCTGTNSCEGGFIWSSPTAKVVPYLDSTIVVAGKENVIPHGSIGIISGQIDNGNFSTVVDRWAGALAPPILRPGNGTTVSCVDDACTISVK